MKNFLDPNKLAEMVSGLRPRENRLSYIFTCPKCNKSEKLWMYKETGTFLCWYCAETEGFKGRPEFALAVLLGRTVSSIRKDLYGSNLPTADAFFDFVLVNQWADTEERVEVPNPELLKRVMWSPDYYPIEHSFCIRGQEYLAGRGIPLPVAKFYGLRYSPIDRRVAFPVGYQGALYGWQARYTGVTEWFDPATGKERKIPKILSTDSLSGQRDKVVQFADQLLGTDQAIICEGPVDAIKCHLCKPQPDMPAGNVATMGKVVSDLQIALIKYSGVRRVYLALDPDAEAECGRITKAFSPDIDVYLMKVPRGFKDFGEMTFEAVRESYLAAKKINPGRVFLFLKPGVQRCRT